MSGSIMARPPHYVEDWQLDLVADVIGEAFADLAVSRFLIPDDAARRQMLTAHLQQMVLAAKVHGVVIANDERCDAVAVWFDVPAVVGLPDIIGYEERRAQVLGEHDERFAGFEAAMHASHPTGVDHWYLALMAVRPARQGCGLGGMLLEHQHARLDRAGRPAYLEAADLRSRELYHRHGYRDLGAPFACGPGGPLLYPMWREPRVLSKERR